VFSIVELKTMPLDSGIPGISAAHMLLLFLMALAVTMVPYAFLYASLLEEKAKAREHVASPFGRMIAWMHAHRHPVVVQH